MSERIDRKRRGLLLATTVFTAGALLPDTALAQAKEHTPALVKPVIAQSEPETVRIAFQKSSPNAAVLKQRGVLERRFKNVVWLEFPAGPQLLEALAGGSADIGVVGDSPPIFAQAAGKELLYVGVEPPRPDASAVLVRKDSPIRSVAELKGRRIAFQKGSSAHYLTVRALEQAGLQLSDVQVSYLTPAEARAAFERGSVDAWTVWDPYYAAAELQGVARALYTGRDAGVNNNAFFLASKAFAAKYPHTILALLEEFSSNDAFLHEQRAEAVALYAAFSGLPSEVVNLVFERRPRAPIRPLSAEVVQDQQRIADTFHRLNLIPRAIRIADVVWRPGPARAAQQ